MRHTHIVTIEKAHDRPLNTLDEDVFIGDIFYDAINCDDALNQYHDQNPIKVLEDFDITVDINVEDECSPRARLRGRN